MRLRDEIDFKDNDFYTYAMTEAKNCWQLNFLPEPTPCFSYTGGKPCGGQGCLVDNSLNGRHMEVSNPVDMELIKDLSHTVCRISSESPDNAEYVQRMVAIDARNTCIKLYKITH